MSEDLVNRMNVDDDLTLENLVYPSQGLNLPQIPQPKMPNSAGSQRSNVSSTFSNAISPVPLPRQFNMNRAPSFGSVGSTMPSMNSPIPSPNLYPYTNLVAYHESHSLGNDEPIQLKDITQSSHPGEEEVTLLLKPLYPKLKLTSKIRMPCVVSLLGSSAELELIEQNRQGMDIVFVVDISGSMGGGKIELVKITMEFVITLLKEFDRVSVIGFTDCAYIYCPLTAMTQTGKEKVTQIVQILGPTGGTHIESGIAAALHLLADRRVINQSSSIMLLSDGCDNSSQTVNERVEARFNYFKPKINDNFRVHTFGYGRDHDSKVMNLMAEKGNGNFYYIENEVSVAEAFGNCLGEMVALVANEIQISLTTLPCEVEFKLVKVYSATGDTVFPVPNLYFGDQKDSVFELEFSALQPDLQTKEVTIKPIEAVATYTLKSGIRERKTATLTIELVQNEEDVKGDQEVLLEYHRVKGGDILKEILKFADGNQMQEATKLAQRAIGEIRSSEVADHPKMKILIKDLEDAKIRASSQSSWNSGGRAQVSSLQYSHANKIASNSCPSYQNTVQTVYSASSYNYMSSKTSQPSGPHTYSLPQYESPSNFYPPVPQNIQPAHLHINSPSQIGHPFQQVPQYSSYNPPINNISPPVHFQVPQSSPPLLFNQGNLLPEGLNAPPGMQGNNILGPNSPPKSQNEYS